MASLAPTFERVRLGRWVATQPVAGKMTRSDDGRTLYVPISGYCATAPIKRLAARRLRRFVAQQTGA